MGYVLIVWIACLAGLSLEIWRAPTLPEAPQRLPIDSFHSTEAAELFLSGERDERADSRTGATPSSRMQSAS